MKYINYESDFKIIESLKNNVPISSAPFKFIYYTRFFRNTLEASYDGKEYINCKPTEDGKLVVVFDNHHLGAGPLKVKRYFYLNDSDFKDGVCDLVSEESLDIYLDKDSATEGCEVDSKVSAYYHVIENTIIPEDPFKHPDLSTQPSILSYKFAGNYVYEQMVWVDGDKLAIELSTIDLIKFSDYNLPLNPSIILDYNIFTVGDSYLGNCSPIYSIYNFSFNIISNNEKIFLQRGSGKIDCKGIWIRLVWSYLTKQEGNYYNENK